MQYAVFMFLSIFFSIMAIRARMLITSALWLAGVSAMVAVLFYLFGAHQVAVVELSVGAGLVTVLFVFAISIAGEEPGVLKSLIPTWLGVGPSFQDPQFQATRTDQKIFDTINLGHAATGMIGWGDILSAEQIQQLVELIRQFKLIEPEPQPTQSLPSFSTEVLPIFEQKCVSCHGNLGGWDGTNYEDAMNSGDHAPVIIPGDVENSLLAQKLLGTQSEGSIMPPGGKLADDEIQIILDWIADGAMDN